MLDVDVDVFKLFHHPILLILSGLQKGASFKRSQRAGLLEPSGPFFFIDEASIFLSGAWPVLPIGVVPEPVDDYEVVMYRV